MGLETTGFGCDLTFGTQAYDPDMLGITPAAEEVPDVNMTDMNDTGHEEYIAGDLIEGGEVTCDVAWDPDDDPVIGGANETVTLTFTHPTLGTPANYSFSGYIKRFQPGRLEKNKRYDAQVVIKVASDVTRNDASA